MDNVELEELTIAQLIADYIEPANIEIKNPKITGKPNKTEIIEAVLKHKEYSDKIKKERAGKVIKAPQKVNKGLKEGVVLRKQTELELHRKEMLRKDRVIIFDNQEKQTKEETITVSWGDRGIGNFTDIVSLSGDPQYVRRGAINNLIDSHAVVQVPKKGGGVHKEYKKRFVVQEVQGLTNKELEELASQQRMRNSKTA